ncbi:BPTI/Kunitz domain-containing protein-like [Pieris napi]|uniref:BPTI/Kunitz domain-containing protein-like n=1 Tax=Pieris napi TaxID=78633 RepID=UPI001FB9B1E8|nr:BPTI/Kunitz domain-containing protein-like [Pieris napi]
MLLVLITLFIQNILALKQRYHTYKEPVTRVTPYVSEVIDKTCLLNPDKGPCRGEIIMYYFDPKTKDCSKFFWGGCQGNGNRFDSRYDCIQNCLRAPDGRRQRPRWCSLTFDYGFCFGSLTRWYYDPIWKVCKERIYSGCGGNRNNFYNKEQCESICTYQTGVLKTQRKKKDRVKKILIINPIGATSKRGKSQRSTTKLLNITANKTQ